MAIFLFLLFPLSLFFSLFPFSETHLDQFFDHIFQRSLILRLTLDPYIDSKDGLILTLEAILIVCIADREERESYFPRLISYITDSLTSVTSFSFLFFFLSILPSHSPSPHPPTHPLAINSVEHKILRYAETHRSIVYIQIDVFYLPYHWSTIRVEERRKKKKKKVIEKRKERKKYIYGNTRISIYGEVYSYTHMQLKCDRAVLVRGFAVDTIDNYLFTLRERFQIIFMIHIYVEDQKFQFQTFDLVYSWFYLHSRISLWYQSRTK